MLENIKTSSLKFESLEWLEFNYVRRVLKIISLVATHTQGTRSKLGPSRNRLTFASDLIM